MNWTALVDAQDLAAHLGRPDLVLVDCRFELGDAAGGERAWRASHLPGAHYAHLDEVLSDHRKPAGEGRHPLPDAATFCAWLGSIGVTAATQVVAYDASDGAMAAARLWWLLKLMGHERAAVLDGGFAAWQALRLPVSSAEVTRRAAVAFPCPDAFAAAALVDSVEVEGLRGDGSCLLIDARAAARFRGENESIDPVAGHIPGAVNRPFADNLRHGRFKPAALLREEFLALLAGRAAQKVVVHCGSGVTACHHLLAMHHADLPGARLYAPSWSGWISDPTRPVATGD